MTRRLRRWAGWLATVVTMAGALAQASATLRAHEIRPAIATLSTPDASSYAITVSLNLEALLAGIGPEHQDSNDAPEARQYNGLRALPPEVLRQRFDAFAARWLGGVRLEIDGRAATPRIVAVEIPTVGELALARISTVDLAGPLPKGAAAVRWTYASAFGASVIRVKPPGGGETQAAWLKAGEAGPLMQLAGGPATTFVARLIEYAAIGFTHILPKGIDHILFVVGLYLLSAAWRPLLIQVTAFTIAHSITLGLGLYGVVQMSPAVVEPLIAASIVYVAVENVLTPRLTVWRPYIVFAFGLLHGLGFAGVLHEIGLSRPDYAVGLIGFNLGVELGQLAVIALAFLATGYWFREMPWYRRRIVQPASIVIALIATYWTIERLLV